jgi:putative ABC transport system permease protein
MVVSEAMARTPWPGEEAIGQCLRIGKAGAPCVAVLGVVQNAHRDG